MQLHSVLYTFCLLLHISYAASRGPDDFNVPDNTSTLCAKTHLLLHISHAARHGHLDFNILGSTSTNTISSEMLQGTTVLIVMHAGLSTCYLCGSKY